MDQSVYLTTRTLLQSQDITDYKCTIGTGNDFTIFISGKGKLKYYSGFGDSVGTEYDLKLKSFKLNQIFIEVACSSNEFVALDNYGVVWWKTIKAKAIPIKNIPEINSVAAGEFFFIFITNDRTIYSYGKSPFKHEPLEPYFVDSLTNISMVRCGSGFMLALCENGNLYGIGKKYIGGTANAPVYRSVQLILTNCKNIISMACTSHSVVILLKDGSVYGAGMFASILSGDGHYFKRIPVLKDVWYVESNATAFYFVDKDNTTWSVAPTNSYGELGLGDCRPRKVPCNINQISIVNYISRGFGSHCFIQEFDGTIWRFGNNTDNQCGLKYEKTIITPIKLDDSQAKKIVGRKRTSAKSARK